MSTSLKVDTGDLLGVPTMGRDRRRPKRQRTPTTLYTDDNPSTFTTKIRKGDRVEPELKPPKPSFYFVEEDVEDDSSSPSKKRPYRRRKPYHKDDMLEMTTAEKLEALSQERQMTAAAEPAVDPSVPVKRKRGRPPKNKNLIKPATVAPPATVAVTASTVSTAAAAPMTSSSSLETAASAPLAAKAVPAPVSPSKAVASSTPLVKNPKGKREKVVSSSPEEIPATPPPPLNDLEGVFVNHAVRLAPILPPVVQDSSAPLALNGVSKDNNKSCSQVVQSLGKVTTPLESPQWAPLYQPNVYFDDDYDADTNRLPDDLTPVTRSITCMTTRKPDHSYMAVGDSMGFCIIYSLEAAVLRPVARLETVACQQRAIQEQEKIRDQQRRKRKSLVVDTSQTTIHALGMIGDRVVLATACELECMDVPSQTSLWVCPLAQDRLVTSLDVHPSRFDVLVSCSLFDNAAMLGQSSPLMLLQHSQNNVEVCDANAPILLKSPCCTAIWDNSKNVENRLLFVAVANEELELILVQGGSIDNWKVACKTRIPVKQSNHFTSLRQSPQGTYTLVACSRGIRLYQTETLELIHVYGDQLALHGQSIVWKDCLMLGKRLPPGKFRLCHDTAAGTNSSANNVECDDWLQDEDDEPAEASSDLGQYVIGVPHYKGPKELTETLHVWRVEQASVVPAISLPLPLKSDGVQALVSAPTANGDRLIVASRDGEAHVLQPRMKSNFAGIMYPPGYQVITDNLDYMEDEGELDQVVEPSSASKENAVTESKDNDDDDDESASVNVFEDEMDEDLREAMRRSLLEQKLERQRRSHIIEDVDVDVVYPLKPQDAKGTLIPCRPEAYLRQAVNSQMDDDDDVEEEQDVAEQHAHEEDQPNGSPSKVHAAVQQPVQHDPKLFVSNILESLGHANPKKHEGGGDFSFSVTAKVVIASAPPSSSAVVVNRGPVAAGGRHAKRSRAASLEALIKSSIDPRLQRFMFSKQACAADGNGSKLAPLPLFPKQVTPSPDAGDEAAADDDDDDDEDDEKEHAVVMVNGGRGGNGATKLDALQTKIRQDEAAVALGLLGLSPNHVRGVQNPDTDPSDTASRSSSQNDNNQAHAYSSKAGSDRDSDFVIMETRKEPKMDPNCHACRGRLVIHSCGKRALPIDFDEMAKVEREKREKEEEARKARRQEKRRLADQRRRDARKQKQRELEEQRRREEEELRKEREQLIRLEETRQQTTALAAAPSYTTIPAPAPTPTLTAADLERQRREMIVASYANHISHATAVPSQPAAMEVNSVDYNRRSYATEAAVPAASPPVTSWERVPTAASREVADSVSAYRSSLNLPSGSTSMATLSSADALVALASFAGIKADQHQQEQQQLQQQQQQQQQNGQGAGYHSSAFVDRAAAAATHGFGAALGNPKQRAIPSFAALRGQESAAAAAAAATAASRALLRSKPLAPDSAAAAAATTATYVWPPRGDQAGVKWPPSSSQS